MMAEDQRVVSARKLTSFPLPAFAGRGSRESSVFGPTTLGPRSVTSMSGDSCTHPRTRAAGFSLLEVLVAFVILALVGTALFRLFGASLNNASLADEYSRATLYAESRLAAAAVETPLREGSDQGASDDRRYAWSTKVESYAPPGATADQERVAQMLPLRPWRLTVTVSWPGDFGSQRSLSLSTVRLAIRQP
jgi:general secretion pathway protein I